MANRCILQIALLLSFSTISLSLSYKLLQAQQRSSSLACGELLKQLKGKPEYCLKDRMDFKFPEEIKQPQHFRKENAALVIQEMLQNILDIVRKNFSNTVWNETIVENLLVELHQQMDSLKTLLQEILEKKDITWEDTMIIPRLKGYYWRIRRHMKAKDNSICAWTVVQVELSRNFSFINRLTDYFQD
ncbi:Interferon beta [Heterocephalus glaber]|uniref:Interferon beta n=1 Tax=Heterocephalus glaber TaxID=10181 RepID=G5CB66_HETGA|nr:interferon beta [Heterocephalus glaber]XP_004875658.1 interferon beta-like [Heterocephalus glaber]EHB18777.1 Interferon beta [Heterocephalus glaber]